VTYSERSARLTIEASVAVLVLLGASPEDVEFIPLRPKPANERFLADIRARWSGRGLRSVGVVGLVGTSPRWVLKEDLDSEQVSALCGGFLAYLNVLVRSSFAEEMEAAEAAEIAELECLYQLPDIRPE
jgi:hypothetical protein